MPQVFLFSISLLFVNKYHYSVEVTYANHTRPFFSAGAYTASDNALAVLKSGLATRDYIWMSIIVVLHGQTSNFLQGAMALILQAIAPWRSGNVRLILMECSEDVDLQHFH